MHSSVLATVSMSVYLSVCLSVTHWYCVRTMQPKIVKSSQMEGRKVEAEGRSAVRYNCIVIHLLHQQYHPSFGTCCHLISRTVTLVANSSSRTLRLGSLCKPNHKRRL